MSRCAALNPTAMLNAIAAPLDASGDELSSRARTRHETSASDGDESSRRIARARKHAPRTKVVRSSVKSSIGGAKSTLGNLCVAEPTAAATNIENPRSPRERVNSSRAATMCVASNAACGRSPQITAQAISGFSRESATASAANRACVASSQFATALATTRTVDSAVVAGSRARQNVVRSAHARCASSDETNRVSTPSSSRHIADTRSSAFGEPISIASRTTPQNNRATSFRII
mmetsp:Transcript_4249/g.16289  ORF Transcript_4249/g.16289 Transcript_4249/m.16289 type:complete len:234 (+) Transcript_4249:659-1360(+)